VALKEALSEDFKRYQKKIVVNARALAQSLAKKVSASSPAGRTRTCCLWI